MPSIRVQFSMSVVASHTDSKSNAWALNTSQFLDDDDDIIYAFPEQFRAVHHHDKLFALPAAITACKNMPKRHAQCSFRVTLPEDVAMIYSNSDGNPIFHSDPLDVFADISRTALSTDTDAASSSHSITAAVKEAVLAATATTASAVLETLPRSISSITKDAVIAKFNPKQHNCQSGGYNLC